MNPVLVNVWRGSAIESHHRGSVVVVDHNGHVEFSLGDTERPVFPRSAIKFLQAIPLLESGAADRYQLTDKHLSFACASHNAEPVHTDFAQQWLRLIGCDVDDLECGAEMPTDQQSQFDLISAGQTPRRYHHNCSGKHLSLLSVSRHMNFAISNYRLYHHPVQRLWFNVLEDLANVRVDQMPWGYDGCGIPTLGLPLQRVALAMARFARPAGLNESRANAITRLTRAVAAHPHMIAGAQRLCTALISLTGTRVLVKTGAEGYYCATLPEAGLGVALKIDDGNRRGSEVAIGAVLRKLGILSDSHYQQLSEYLSPNVANSRGEIVGRIEPSSVWEK